MSQARSTNQRSFRLSAIQANRQRIARNADAEEIERQRLMSLNKRLAAEAKPTRNV
jgi:hypothetical protein